MDESLQLDFLAGLQATGIKPGLGRIRRLLARLDHPERRFPSVLISGTNGKGSTASFLAAILRAAGLRTGLFTSPHLVDVRERFCINGDPLALNLFLRYGARVRAAMDAHPGQRRIRATFFEALTAIGFLAFAEADLDMAVVEVGMGGRLDSTNVLSPCASILTNVTLDHARYLGATPELIAAEKVDIARPGRVLVTGVDDRVFDAVVAPALEDMGATALRAGRDFRLVSERGSWRFEGRRWHLPELLLSLPGSFQADNAALAAATAEVLADQGWPLHEADVRTGLASAVWAGRWQTVAQEPLIILDGGHNPGAAVRVAETLTHTPLPHPAVLVHASKPDKDHATYLRLIAPFFDHVIETTMWGLADPALLAFEARNALRHRPGQAAAVVTIPDLGSAVHDAIRRAGTNGSVLIAGSLYLVGAALATRPWEQTPPKTS